MAPCRFATVPVAELAEKGLVPDLIPPLPLVLVVDDEPAIAETLTWILERAGFAATTASCGDDALEIARLTPPDLLLSDVVMPGMNGIELAHRISGLAPDCKVLLLSGQAQTVDLFARLQLPERCFKILAKPIPPLELLGEITLLLGQSQRDQQSPAGSRSTIRGEKKCRPARRMRRHGR